VRTETFLVRYPRKLKVILTFVMLGLLLAVSVVFGERPVSETVLDMPALPSSPIPSAVIHQPDKQTGLPNRASEKDPDHANAEAMNDFDDHNVRMARAPDAGLTEITADGGLPKIGDDGRKPWQVYARPFNMNDKRPRIAIVMADLGLSRVATDVAVRRLPAVVTLAFDVESPVTASWLGRARQDGHETLISLPMEPFDFPRSDPGPNALLTHLPGSDVTQRINWALKQGAGYVGVTTLSGSRFTADPAKVSLLLNILKQRGLMIFDAHVAPHSVVKDLAQQTHLPVAVSTLHIDRDPSPGAIDAALHQLEQAAQLNGRAVGVASPLPVTLDHLDAWIKQLPARGVALAPVSAVVE
jgi:uncharacterized protein